MTISYPTLKWLTAYIALFLLDIFAYIYGRNFYFFIALCLCFWISLFFVERKYHWGLYVLFGFVVYEYRIIIPLLVAGIGYVNFSSKLNFISKSTITIISLLSIQLFYVIPSAKQLALTKNLKNGDIFFVCINSLQITNSSSIYIEEPTNSGLKYILHVKYDLNGESYAITISQDKRDGNRVYFNDMAKYFNKNTNYVLEISADFNIPDGTLIIFQATMPWGKAVINGFRLDSTGKCADSNCKCTRIYAPGLACGNYIYKSLPLYEYPESWGYRNDVSTITLNLAIVDNPHMKIIGSNNWRDYKFSSVNFDLVEEQVRRHTSMDTEPEEIIQNAIEYTSAAAIVHELFYHGVARRTFHRYTMTYVDARYPGVSTPLRGTGIRFSDKGCFWICESMKLWGRR